MSRCRACAYHTAPWHSQWQALVQMHFGEQSFNKKKRKENKTKERIVYPCHCVVIFLSNLGLIVAVHQWAIIQWWNKDCLFLRLPSTHINVYLGDNAFRLYIEQYPSAGAMQHRDEGQFLPAFSINKCLLHDIHFKTRWHSFSRTSRYCEHIYNDILYMLDTKQYPII